MIKLCFTGDVTIDRPMLNASKKADSSYDFSGCLSKNTKSAFEADLLVGNLETTFSGSSKKYNNGLHYNTPDSFVDEVKRAGFDVVTTANNHCFDGGINGLKRTLDVLDNVEIEYTGTFKNANDKKYIIKNVNGVKVGILSLTYGVNVYSDIKIPKNINDYVNLLKPVNSMSLKYKIFNKLFSPALVRQIKILLKIPTISVYQDQMHKEYINNDYLDRIKVNIKAMKAEADYTVCALHIGGQFNEEAGEYSKYMVKFLKECGIDAVVGNHPHTIQKTEIENDTICAYSLGGLSLSPSAIYINHECIPEYSELINIYIDEETKKCVKATFSLLKIVEDENQVISVVPVSNLEKQGLIDEKTLKEVSSLYQRITGKVFDGEIKEEYVLITY